MEKQPRPSVLILDDGELDTVRRMLLKMDVKVKRLQSEAIRQSVPTPTDLLITSGNRTLNEMPELDPPLTPGQPPIWVCIHSQDFMPMRERMREMGVHFLLQNALDEDSRRRFLGQLLRKGVERRRNSRLPLGGEIEYGTETPSETGKLVDLAVDGCRILAQEALEPDTEILIRLPASLGGGEPLDIAGRVHREAEVVLHAGHEVYSTAIWFHALDAEECSIVESAIRGEQIGTRISALAELPSSTSAGESTASGEPESAADDRRAETRHVYDRNVQVLGESEPTLGCDLSLSGVRVAECGGLEDGTRVSVALFGAPREEPIVVDAKVIRVMAGDEVALGFDSLTPAQEQWIQRLLDSSPLIDRLDQSDADAGRTIMAELREARVG